MPRTNQKDDTDNNLKNTPDSKRITKPVDQNKVNADSNTSKKADKNKYEIIVTLPENKDGNEQAIIANRISEQANRLFIYSIIINSIVLVATLILAGAAIYQYRTSQSAAQIAQKTLDITIAYNRSTDSLKKIDAIKADSTEKGKFKRDTAAFNLQAKSVNSQIASLKEIQKQSESYLQIKIKGPIEYSNGTITFYYQIVNLGKYPAKLTSFYMRLAAGEKKDSAKWINKIFEKPKYKKAVAYVTNSNEAENSPFSTNGFTDEYFNLYKLGLKKFWLGGEWFYRDEISKRNKKYTFVCDVKYTANDGIIYEMIKSENKTVP